VLNKPFLIGIGFGIIGGLVGTVLMDMVMMLTFVIAGQPATTFFSMVGEKFGYGVVAGIVVHNLVGLTGGFIFSFLVLNVKALHLDSRRKGLMLGIAAGAITIPLGCIPLALWLGQSILEVIAFSILPHLVWGAVVGWIVGYGLLSFGQPSRLTTELEM
jgi:hypothetical protein